MATKKTEATALEIQPLKTGKVTLRMIGTTPMYFNSMSSKAMRDLLVEAARRQPHRRKRSSTIQRKSFATASTENLKTKHCYVSLHLELNRRWRQRPWKQTALRSLVYNA